MSEDVPTVAAAAVQPTAVAEFSAFYRSEVRALVNFLLWQGASLPEAADLAQETMMLAYRHWSNINHPRAWIRRVASREFGRSRLRHQVEEPVGDDLEDHYSLLKNDCDQIREFEQKQDVLRLINTLPPRQRQVMAWSLDGFTASEIAETLGLSASSVRTFMQLARRNLAGLVANESADSRTE